MRLNGKDIKEGLDELLTLPDVSSRIGARYIIREAKNYIRQLEADLRRQGFTEYNTKEEDNDQ
jgi:hypothetical protein